MHLRGAWELASRSYCHAPISVLDPDAVQKALATYGARRTIDPVSLVDGLLRAQAVRVDDGTTARAMTLAASI